VNQKNNRLEKTIQVIEIYPTVFGQNSNTLARKKID